MSRPIKKSKWTNLDAFGLINGVATWDKNYINLKYVRRPGESNLDLRQKINNRRHNPALGVSLHDLVNGLANELNLEPYNMKDKTSFTLSRIPHPSGDVGVQDISVFYKEKNSGVWHKITPQVWSSGYYTDESQETPVEPGFIVWENGYYKDSLEVTTKTSDYSDLLTIISDIPDESKLKVIFYNKQFDIDNNQTVELFTDVSNELDELDDRLIYRKSFVIDSGNFNDRAVAYHLDDLSDYVSGQYFNDNGTATGKLYRVRDIIDEKFRHRWKDIRTNDTIWDVHRDYSRGTVPSFYDTPFVIPITQDELNTNNFNGGIEYQDSVLSFHDIRIEQDGDVEHWWPVLQPGKFYVDGRPYMLMENPQFYDVEIEDASSGQLPPSGIDRWHHAIVTTESSIESGYIHETYNYPIQYSYPYSTEASGTLHTSPNILRRKPFVTNDMGYDLQLNSGEYYIDFDGDNPVIVGSGLPDNLKIIWDQIEVASGVVCTGIFSDLNPLNELNIPFNKYFFVLGDT